MGAFGCDVCWIDPVVVCPAPKLEVRNHVMHRPALGGIAHAYDISCTMPVNVPRAWNITLNAVHHAGKQLVGMENAGDVQRNASRATPPYTARAANSPARPRHTCLLNGQHSLLACSEGPSLRTRSPCLS